MKNKKYLFLAATAALFAACSSNDATEEVAQKQAPQEVGFSAYVNRAVTRAGAYGDITTEKLKTFNTKDGFGVFGYYTDKNYYDQSAVPNFMYNQQLLYQGSTWTYAPIKYWPNEYGAAAYSEDVDMVTFFAYAPYVEVTPSTGLVKESSTLCVNPTDATGIVGMKNNTNSGDPMIKYVASVDPAKSVDLLWGVVGGTSDYSWKIINTAETQTMKYGLPWLDVQRPEDATGTQKLTFTFNHALAKLNVQIDADVDGTDETYSVAANNKIFVRSITFNGIPSKAALNLNNATVGANKANWMSFDCRSDLEAGGSITVYDGRMDGKEGVFEATNEKVTGLNPVIVEDDVWGSTKVGVTNSPVNLFNGSGLTTPIYVIPSGEYIDVTIVYEVEAADNNLPTYLADGATRGSRIKNTITKTNVFTKGLENGKAYTLNLHLGMNSVKFDAEVTGWTDETPQDVDLPSNEPVTTP